MSQPRGLGKTFSELLASMPEETRTPTEATPRSELDGVHLRLDDMGAELRELRYLVQAILAAVERLDWDGTGEAAAPTIEATSPLALVARSAAAFVESACAAISIPFAVSRQLAEWLRPSPHD